MRVHKYVHMPICARITPRQVWSTGPSSTAIVVNVGVVVVKAMPLRGRPWAEP